MKPQFEAGNNIAIKVPPHQYEKTVSFYRDILSLEQLDNQFSGQSESAIFKFGDKKLWIDKVTSFSQAEIWLEIKTDKIEEAARYFKECKIIRRDEIEELPEGFKGF
ncbi:MAG: hypothetical protein IME96_10235 [Proteobacteria bacterium]|nr:hypothetical protein [Pseudomonadota bacterium]